MASVEISVAVAVILVVYLALISLQLTTDMQSEQVCMWFIVYRCASLLSSSLSLNNNKDNFYISFELNLAKQRHSPSRDLAT